jgi:2-haloacid dehalogenase
VGSIADQRAVTVAVGNTCAVPTRKINAVVFDLGGVLIDWNPRHLYRRLFADADEMEEFLATICTDEWHREHDLGADIKESCEGLASLHPDHRDMIMAWAEHGEEMAAGQLDQNVGVLSELRVAGVRCYALSNMEPEAFTIRYERFPFMKWFDGYVVSGIEGIAKPDLRIFEILLERYGLQPVSTVFVDDSKRNIDAARALGFNVVHYTSTQRLRRELRALGTTENP